MRQHPRTGDLHAPLFEPTSDPIAVTKVLPASARPTEKRAVRPRQRASRSGPPVAALAAALALVAALAAVVLTRGL